MMENEVFVTRSIDLAAYFMSCEIESIAAKEEENKCVFDFPKDDKTMEAFRNFKNDAWLKRYNQNRRTCLKTMHEVKNQVNQ